MKETTVLIPIYNSAKFLDRCIRSVISQINYDNFDVVCVNDGSTDESARILEQYKDRVVILENLKNEGLPFSLNKGIKASVSQFIVRVDADDYVSRDFLSLLTLTLKSNPEIAAVACDYELFSDNLSTIIKNSSLDPIACGIMFRRDVLIDVGLYDEEFRIHEEKEFMTRYLEKYTVERLPIPLYRYRQHDNNMTKNSTLSEHYEMLLQKIKKRSK